jgi:hypothetical protein
LHHVHTHLFECIEARRHALSGKVWSRLLLHQRGQLRLEQAHARVQRLTIDGWVRKIDETRWE